MIRSKLITIFFICLFVFRLALVLQNLVWFQDTANDQFFAVKIVNDLKDGKFIVQEGITNSGLNVRYPPYYTFLLAFLRLVNNTYESTLVFHIFLTSLLPILIYKIAKLLSSESGGIIAMLVALTSPILLEVSTVVYSAYLPLPFAFVALYILIKELLSKNQKSPLIIFSLFLTASLTTFSYALNFQLVLSAVLIVFLTKKTASKYLYVASTVFFFLLFNFKSILQFSLYNFIKSNFQNLFFPATEVYKPGVIENIIQQFYNKPETVFLGLFLIISLVTYLIKSKFKNENRKKTVLILIAYWFISTVLISRFGQFYKGIFVYPVLYVVLGCLLENLSQKPFKKFPSRLIFGVVFILIFIIIPTSSLPRLRNFNESHYRLSKNYAQKLVSETDKKTLLLVLSERNNKLIYWMSLNVWYYDYLVNKDKYELFPKEFCPVSLEGECFRIVPDKIRIVCTTQPPEIYIFDIVKKHQCDSEAQRISSIVGAEPYKTTGSFYDIQIDGEKYKNLQESLIY